MTTPWDMDAKRLAEADAVRRARERSERRQRYFDKRVAQRAEVERKRYERKAKQERRALDMLLAERDARKRAAKEQRDVQAVIRRAKRYGL
jgi:hypothetical protein